MARLNQLTKKRRKPQPRSKNLTLQGHPQLSGVVLRTWLMSPKKPNSANRHVARVRLSNGKEITAFVPGEGHTLQEHSRVLVRGGAVPDLPGVRFHVVRGVLDCLPPHQVEPHKGGKSDGRRKQARSKYGQKFVE